MELEEARVTELLEDADIPGTAAYNMLQEINNIANGPRAKNGRRLSRRKPAQVFKVQKVERGERNAGGIDWISYRKTILYPSLHPFLMEIRCSHPDPEIWLVEDNAGPHTAAAKNDAMAAELRDAKIFRCKWSPNSPDMNMIEPIWGDFKVRIFTLLSILTILISIRMR